MGTMVIGTARYSQCTAIMQLAIILMATIGCVRCSSLNGAGGRFMVVEDEEEPPVVPSGIGSLNELLLDMEATSQQQHHHQLSPSSTSATGESIGSSAPNGVASSGGGGGQQCRIEFQVTKVMPGRCTRLGRGSGRACVSGNHLIPFHTDCM